QELGSGAGGGWHQPGRGRRLAAGPARAVGLRQVDHAAADCGPRAARQRHGDDRRRRCHPSDAGAAQDRDGIPVLRVVSPSQRRREHHLRPAGARGVPGRPRYQAQTRRRYRRAVAALGPQACAIVRRPTPAGRAGPRHHRRSKTVPDGRAALQSGRQAAPRDAHRNPQPPAAARHDHGLCHPRPDRGDDHGRPRHPDAGRPDRAERPAGGALQPARDRVYRALHRHPADEPDRARRQAHRDPARAYPDRVAGRSSGPGKERRASRRRQHRALRHRGPTGLGTAGRLCQGRARRGDKTRLGGRGRTSIRSSDGRPAGAATEEVTVKGFGQTILGGALAALLLSAQPAAAVDLTMYYPVAVGGPVTKIIDDMVGRFEKQNPDIKVTAVYAGNYTDTMTKAMTAMKGGQPPQLSVLLSTDVFTLMDENAIVPFDGLVADKSWFKDFYPAFMANGQIDGKTWSIPFQRSTIVLYWNKDAFKDAGLDPEKPPASWDEMIAMGKKLIKKDGSGNVTRWGVEIPTTGYAYWMLQALAIENKQ